MSDWTDTRAPVDARVDDENLKAEILAAVTGALTSAVKSLEDVILKVAADIKHDIGVTNGQLMSVSGRVTSLERRVTRLELGAPAVAELGDSREEAREKLKRTFDEIVDAAEQLAARKPPL